jgi:hypothetical protein
LGDNPLHYSPVYKSMNQVITVYYFYKKVKYQLTRYKFCKEKYINLIQIWVNRNNHYNLNFYYLQIALFNIAKNSRKSFYNFKIYQYF